MCACVSTVHVIVVDWQSLSRPKTLLPIPDQMGIGEHATTSANTEVREQMKQTDDRRLKAYTAFTDKDRVKIGMSLGLFVTVIFSCC